MITIKEYSIEIKNYKDYKGYYKLTEPLLIITLSCKRLSWLCKRVRGKRNRLNKTANKFGLRINLKKTVKQKLAETQIKLYKRERKTKYYSYLDSMITRRRKKHSEWNNCKALKKYHHFIIL